MPESYGRAAGGEATAAGGGAGPPAAQGERPGSLPAAVVGRRADHSPTLVGEEPAIFRSAAGIGVPVKDGEELRGDRHGPNRFPRPVLRTAIVMRPAVVRSAVAVVRGAVEGVGGTRRFRIHRVSCVLAWITFVGVA